MLESSPESLLLGKTGTQQGFSRSISLSEVMTIAVMFHHSHFREFKYYYLLCVQGPWASYFRWLPSYNRFLELMKEVAIPLYIFMVATRLADCTGISFIDSTVIDVCDIHREKQNKVFKGLAKKGKGTMGWFYGFKLHLVVTERGEIVNFVLSAGNVDDRNEKVISKLAKDLFGKLIGDRGYISKDLVEKLLGQGVELLTKFKKNMKKLPAKLGDAILLRKRAVIESVNDFLKNTCQIEQSRHRSPINFMVNLLSGLVAYSYIEKKPSMKTYDKNTNMPAII